jgi:phosphatidylglycerophosphatase A
VTIAAPNQPATRLATLLATVFGAGYLPWAPGTWASLLSLPLAWCLGALGGWPALLAGAVLLTFAGIWACGRHARAAGLKDPSECVIDEVAGQLFACVPLAITARLAAVLPVLLAFVLFRFFDIVKPWPIARLEHLPGGVGVMADDVLAGVLAALLVWFATAQNWI